MSLLPLTLPGFVVDDVSTDAPTLLLEAHASTPAAVCPDCHVASTRVHSRYTRQLRDLPVVDHPLRLRLQVRRFRCTTPACPRQTFAERLPMLAPVQAQRTVRWTEAIRGLGCEAGGEAGARLATRLHMPVSGDTVLRIVRRTPTPVPPTPRVLGLDDVALRKGRVYGTILVDLERQRPVDLLPERTADTVATWLRAHPGVEVIARDRAQDYARGAAAGAPQACQVVDRWHLLCNLREVLERYLQRITPALRCVLAHAAETPEPAPASAPPDSLEAGSASASDTAERVPTPRPLPRYGRSASLQQLQTARQAVRETRYQEVRDRAARGHSLRQIAQATGVSRHTVRRWLRAGTLPPDQRGYRGTGKIDPYLPYLRNRLAAGCTNQSRLWREIRAQGFRGTRSLVAKWLRAHGTDLAGTRPTVLPPLPAARQLAWLCLQTEEQRTVDEQALWARLQQHTELQEVAALVRQGTMMVRQRQADALEAWLHACDTSPSREVRHFVTVLRQDEAAVKAALMLPWSTGPVEGQINRLKLIKRSGYGRMKLDLLRQRVLYDAA